MLFEYLHTHKKSPLLQSGGLKLIPIQIKSGWDLMSHPFCTNICKFQQKKSLSRWFNLDSKWCEKRDLVSLCGVRSVRGSDSPPDCHSTPLPLQVPSLQFLKTKNHPFGWFFLVRETGLEPVRLPTRPSNVRVCRFRHSRIYIVLANLLSYYSKCFSLCQYLFTNFFIFIL